MIKRYGKKRKTGQNRYNISINISKSLMSNDKIFSIISQKGNNMKSYKYMFAGMAVLLILVLSACSSEGKEKTENPTVTVTAVTTEETVSTSEATEISGLDGEALLEQRCTVCHSLDRVKIRKQTYDQWDETVSSMVKKGAMLSEAEQVTLVEYLAETYGK